MSEEDGELVAHLSRWRDGGSEASVTDSDLQQWSGGPLLLEEFIDGLGLAFVQMLRAHLLIREDAPAVIVGM